MRCLAATALCLLLTGNSFAANPVAPAGEVRTTIDRGLAFLAKDAVAWQEKYNCASCHHAAITIWALHEAKGRGFAVDEAVLADLTKRVAESGDGKTSIPRPEAIPKAFNAKAVYFALGLGAVRERGELEQQGLKRLLATVQEDQTDNGSWASWPDTRPPIFGHSDETVTALATLALLPAAAAANVDPAAVAARDRGLQWLAEHQPSGDHQALALRLLLLAKLGRPEAEWQPLAKLLLERQNADGGWSQTPEMASDPHATGQALYALADAGYKPVEPSIQKARAFLIKSQGESGSWTMTSRPTKPGAEGAKNLVPITGQGNAWAILGLVRTSE